MYILFSCVCYCFVFQQQTLIYKLCRTHILRVRHLRTTFNDDVFESLEQIKGDRSWRQAIKQEFGVTDDD